MIKGCTLIKRLNSLTVYSGVANCRHLPFGGGREKASRMGQGCIFHCRNTRGVAANVYLRKTSEKPKWKRSRVSVF